MNIKFNILRLRFARATKSLLRYNNPTMRPKYYYNKHTLSVTEGGWGFDERGDCERLASAVLGLCELLD